MVAYAITRQGFGAVYKFKTALEAYFHPVVQYGDALVENAAEVLRDYSATEWPLLLEHIGAPSADRDDRGAGVVMAYLARVAEDPPRNGDEIIAAVRRDRKKGHVMAKKEKAETTVPAAPIKAAAKPAATPQEGQEDAADEAAERGPALDPAATIHVLKNSEGKLYSEAVPFRPGSKRAIRFGYITEGCTVESVREKGMRDRHINQSVAAGYISLKQPKVPTPKVPKEAPKAKTKDTEPEPAAEAA